MPVENRNLKVGLVTFGHLAAPVRFDWLEQAEEQIGTPPAHLVEDGHGTDQTR